MDYGERERVDILCSFIHLLVEYNKLKLRIFNDSCVVDNYGAEHLKSAAVSRGLLINLYYRSPVVGRTVQISGRTFS